MGHNSIPTRFTVLIKGGPLDAEVVKTMGHNSIPIPPKLRVLIKDSRVDVEVLEPKGHNSEPTLSPGARRRVVGRTKRSSGTSKKRRRRS